MFKNLLQLYSLLICMISVVLMIVVLGLLSFSVGDLVLFQYKYSYELNKFNSNEKYIQHKKQNNKSQVNWSKLSEQEVTNLRLSEKEDYQDQKQSYALYNILDKAGWLIVGFIFFIIHWCLYKKSSHTK